MQLVVSTLGKACAIENRAALERGKLNAVHAQADRLVSEVQPPFWTGLLSPDMSSFEISAAALSNLEPFSFISVAEHCKPLQVHTACCSDLLAASVVDGI